MNIIEKKIIPPIEICVEYRFQLANICIHQKQQQRLQQISMFRDN